MSTLDTRTIADKAIPGLSYKIDVAEDYTASPDDYDSYTPAQKKAWEDGEWFYVGLIVTPVIAGIELDDFTDSLWGIEWGHLTLTDDAGEVTGHLNIGLDLEISGSPLYGPHLPDMIAEVQANLTEGLGPFAATLAEVGETLTRRELDGQGAAGIARRIADQANLLASGDGDLVTAALLLDNAHQLVNLTRTFVHKHDEGVTA